MNNSYLIRKFINPIYLIEKIWLYGRSIYILHDKDIILAFFPKTGSTWIRYFLFNVLTNGCRANNTANFDGLNKIMPEFGNPSLFNPWPFDECPRLVKTHRPYCFLFRNNRAILTIRDPRDIMVSFYHYASAKKVLNFNGSFEGILHHPEMGLEAFLKHYSSWKNIAKLVMKYEDFKENPFDNFKKLCHFCGIKADEKRVKRAIERSSLENMRKAQEYSTERFKGKFKPGFLFVREGKVGQWQDYFDDKALDYYKKLSHSYKFDIYN